MKEKFDMQNVKSRDKDEQAQHTHTHTQTMIMKLQRKRERGRKRGRERAREICHDWEKGCKQTQLKCGKNRLSSQKKPLPLAA